MMTQIKLNKGFLAGGTLLPLVFLSFQAHAGLYSVTPTYNPTSFGAAGGGWETGSVGLLPSDTTIGSSSLELDVSLTQAITLTDLGAGFNYGFGMAGFNPLLNQNDQAFTFSIQLLNGGTDVGPSFGFTLNNPFAPPTSPLNNLYVTTSTGIGSTGPGYSITFDEIEILVSNSQQDLGVTSFAASLGVNNPTPLTPVPEPTTMIAGALALLPFGLQGIRFLRNRKQTA